MPCIAYDLWGEVGRENKQKKLEAQDQGKIHEVAMQRK
jgi:hypothetical protein